METFWILFGFLVVLLILFWLLLLPVQIAEKRGVSDNELSTIRILCWCSLLIGITWFVALILSLVYQPQKWTDKSKGSTNMNLEGLEKLFDLKEKGIITQEEYEIERKKLIGQQ